MTEWILYYNPKCGTCRKAKELLEGRGARFKTVEYLAAPPAVEQLEEILRKLKAGPEAITRFKEPLWQLNNLAAAPDVEVGALRFFDLFDIGQSLYENGVFPIRLFRRLG